MKRRSVLMKVGLWVLLACAASVQAQTRAWLDRDRIGEGDVVTLNIETELSQVAVINLLFDRGIPAEVDKAHACAEALHAVIEEEGLSPYRARIDMMARLAADTRGASQAYWQHVAALKQVFDPDGIIAPGRYDLR